jgi:hypothetical protein
VLAVDVADARGASERAQRLHVLGAGGQTLPGDRSRHRFHISKSI